MMLRENETDHMLSGVIHLMVDKCGNGSSEAVMYFEGHCCGRFKFERETGEFIKGIRGGVFLSSLLNILVVL